LSASKHCAMLSLSFSAACVSHIPCEGGLAETCLQFIHMKVVTYLTLSFWERVVQRDIVCSCGWNNLGPLLLHEVHHEKAVLWHAPLLMLTVTHLPSWFTFSCRQHFSRAWQQIVMLNFAGASLEYTADDLIAKRKHMAMLLSHRASGQVWFSLEIIGYACNLCVEVRT